MGREFTCWRDWVGRVGGWWLFRVGGEWGKTQYQFPPQWPGPSLPLTSLTLSQEALRLPIITLQAGNCRKVVNKLLVIISASVHSSAMRTIPLYTAYMMGLYVFLPPVMKRVVDAFSAACVSAYVCLVASVACSECVASRSAGAALLLGDGARRKNKQGE